MTYFKCNNQLKEFPNAIGLCGHWHTSLANWGNIYYERNYNLFPYINCGACRYDGENGLDQKCLKEKPAPQRDSVDNHFEFPSRQGLVVSVYFSSVGCGAGYEMNEGRTRLDVPKSKLPAGKTLRIAVRPISSLGTKGRAIGTVWPTAPKTVRTRWS